MSTSQENTTKSRVEMKIAAPNIEEAEFKIIGTAPLVVHRFSHKAKNGMLAKIAEGTKANAGKKKHEATDTDDTYNSARYISSQGWDGFNASAIRCAMIRACSLCNFKMTTAKMSVFVVADGRDALEPEYGLVRIYGEPRKLEMVGRVETGQAYITVRPIYDEWSAVVRLRYDADQFTRTDVANLLMRSGEQVGICEGRPSSKNSAGMGWGTFRLAGKDEA